MEFKYFTIALSSLDMEANSLSLLIAILVVRKHGSDQRNAINFVCTPIIVVVASAYWLENKIGSHINSLLALDTLIATKE